MEALNTSIEIKEEPLPENHSSDEDGKSTNMDNINVEDLPEDYFADLIGLNVVDEWAEDNEHREKRPGSGNKSQHGSQQKSSTPSSNPTESAKQAQVTGAKPTTSVPATPASDSQNVPKIKSEPKSPVNPDDDEDTIPFDPTQTTNENLTPSGTANDSSNLNMSLRLRQEMTKPTATASETVAKSNSEQLPDKSNKQTQSPSKLAAEKKSASRNEGLEDPRSADRKLSGKNREEKKSRSEKHAFHESKEKRKKSPSRKRRSSKSPERRSRDHFSMSPEAPKPKTERLKVHPGVSGTAPGIVPLMNVDAFMPLIKGALANSEAASEAYRSKQRSYSPRRRSRSPRRYSPGRRYKRSRSPASRRSRSPLPRRSRSPLQRRSRSPVRRRSRSPIPRRSRSPAMRRSRSRSPSRRSRSPRKRRSYTRSPRRRSISRSPSRRSNRSPGRRRSSSEERYIARLNSRRRRQANGSPDSPLSMSISPSPPRRKSPLKVLMSRSKSPTRARSPWKQPEWKKDVPSPTAPLTTPPVYPPYTAPQVTPLMPSTQQPAPYYNMSTQPPPPGTASFPPTPYYTPGGGFDYGASSNFQQPAPPLGVPPSQQLQPVPLPPVVYPNLVPRPVPPPSVQSLVNKPSMMFSALPSSNMQPPADAPVPGRPGLRVINMAKITDPKLPIAKTLPPRDSSSDSDDNDYEVAGIPTDMPLSSFLEASLDVGKKAPIKSYIIDTVETSIEKLETNRNLMIAPPFIVNPDRNFESVRKSNVSTSKNHPSIFLKGPSTDMRVPVAISSLNIRAVHLPRKPKFLPQQRMLAKALLKQAAVPTSDACTMTDPMPEPEPAECMECFIRNEKDYMNRWTQTLPPVRHSIYVQVGTGLESIHNPVTFRNSNAGRFENRLGPQREVVLVENETIAFGYAPRSTLPKPPQPPSPPRYPLETRYKQRSPDSRSPPNMATRNHHGFIDHDRPEFDPMNPPGPSNPPPRVDIRSRLAPPDDRFFNYGAKRH